MAATLVVRRLDLIVDHTLADSNDLRAVWKQARRVENPRRRGAALSLAAVVDMPAQEAA